MMKQRHRHTKPASFAAFTLIELLVVVAIIAALLSILVPALSKAKNQAKRMAGLSNLKEIGKGAGLYADQWNDNFPTGLFRHGEERMVDGEMVVTVASDHTNWVMLIQATLMGEGFTIEERVDQKGRERNTTHKIFQDPNAALPGGSVHYTANPLLMPDLTPGEPVKHTYKRTSLVRAAEIIFVADGPQHPIGKSTTYGFTRVGNGALFEDASKPTYYDPADEKNNEPLPPGPNEDTLDGLGHIRFRQLDSKAANVLFADMHAESQFADRLLVRNVRPDP